MPATPSTPSNWRSRAPRPDDDGVIHITLDVAQESIQRRAVLYDKDGDAHYDTISAFIKSVRGSDPDAALYWLAKMLYAGEDPRFILRRLIILAGEDIGLADPMGLVVANAAAQAFDYIGLPEGVYPIVEATLYLATAPKSNTAGAYFKAFQLIEQEGITGVPQHLQDANRDAKPWVTARATSTRTMIRITSCPSSTCRDLSWAPISTSPPTRVTKPRSETRLERWREAQRQALGIEDVSNLPDLSQDEIDSIKSKHKAG